jgi:hypothetical protein
MFAARFVLVASALLFLAACEGLFTGTQEQSHPLTQAEDGSFDAITMQLTPEMNPIAFNFHGETIADANDSGRWNTYQATLSLDGATVASASFSINNTGTRDHTQGNAFAQTLFFANVPQAGEYRLAIVPARPKEITIEQPRVEIRRNTQPPR